MTISGIYGGVGIGMLQPRQPWQNNHASGNQVEVSQTSLTESSAPQITPESSPAQNGFSAMLGNMAASGVTLDASGPSQDQFFMPPPAQGSSGQGSFGSSFAGVLEDMYASGVTGIKGAATAIQDAFTASSVSGASAGAGSVPALQNGSASVSAETSVGAPVASDASTASVGASSPASVHTQSSFLSDLGNLLSAMEAGDGDGSQAAASALLGDIEAQAEAFQTQLANAITQPFSAGQGGSLSNVISSYFQWN
jgi:hypothetical protein